MTSKEHPFIRFGEDRIRLDSIAGYGIRTITRYFVRNEAHSEVDKNTYEGYLICICTMMSRIRVRSTSTGIPCSWIEWWFRKVISHPKRLMCRRRVHCMSEASRWEVDGRCLPPCFTTRANAGLTSMPNLSNWMNFSSTSRKIYPTNKNSRNRRISYQKDLHFKDVSVCLSMDCVTRSL